MGGGVLVDEDEGGVFGEDGEGGLVEGAAVAQEEVGVEVYDHVGAVLVVQLLLVGVRVV